MYKKIRNPENNKLININSKLGHIILKKYLYSLYGGNPEKNVFMPDEGWVTDTTSPKKITESTSDQQPSPQGQTPDTHSQTPDDQQTSPITSENLIQRIINEVHHFNVNGIDTYLQTHESLLNIFNYFNNNIDETVDALIENPRFTVTRVPRPSRNNVVRSLQFENI